MTILIKQITKISQNGPTILFNKSIHTSGGPAQSLRKWYQSLWTPRNLNVHPPYDHITQIGDPVLRQKSVEVPVAEIKSKEVGILLDQMTKVLRKYKCVGLAAPQIGIPLRVIMLEFTDSMREQFSAEVYKNRQMEILPLTILINPEIKITNYNKHTFVEACASVQGYSADVARYEEALLSGYDRNGAKRELPLKGWNARIAQHEMDHLNGTVYTDIMKSTTFTCTCWQAVNAREGRVNIPFTPK